MTATHVHERHLSEQRTVRAADVGEVDVVVLGGGPTGENVAARAVRGGLSAVLVEADLLGGECSYWACMPSKALLRPVHALAAARRVPGAREAVTGELDVPAALRYRDAFTSGWDDGHQVEWAEGAGIAVVRGWGRLAGQRRVEVTARDGSTATITARSAVVVATGSTPRTPPVEGLDAVAHWGSREATSAKEVPARLAVVGGGVVGVEMSAAFAGLGSQVVLLAHSRVLSRFEERAGELVADGLRAAGVDVRTGTTPARVERAGADGPVTLTTEDGARIVADELLVATGRRPNTGDLGLETVGLSAGEPLAVDPSGLVRGVPGAWLSAAGDVTGQAPLTHMGKYSARATGDAVAARAAGRPVRDGAWGEHAATAQQRAVPQVVFTDPEVASVGPTAAEAEEAGVRVRCVDLDLAVAGSSIQAEGYTGWARIVVDEDRRVVVGATFVGQDVAELLHSATVAVVGEVPLERLWHAVPSFPTISEIWLRLLEGYGL
ncbi:NAD(P)/FAD-dependent oxidoreductase [Quadrisphaera sp. DSM 44207]|uniref:dihydrolipoyl dehydrogenase family protein n=1 Tax=Quadrisphaera sp. DSM 44207 TaxID=1881057 RepID=UPI00087E2EC4|nr:NAD(P)/FAD-dependent oxidoreductase [Quadrisphaera sp. DSM 44207]SDQ87162.1 dihydrolipoamide dehydrogenase [Quadrisphaera sp. DSM 44207]